MLPYSDVRPGAGDVYQRRFTPPMEAVGGAGVP